jgi:hypothetical protein
LNKKSKNKKGELPPIKYIRLKNLKEGTPFIFSSGEKSFKGMYLVYSGDARCVVEGFKCDDGGPDAGWRHFRDNCAPDAEVLVDWSRPQKKIVATTEKPVEPTNVEGKPKKIHKPLDKMGTKVYKLNENQSQQQNKLERNQKMNEEIQNAADQNPAALVTPVKSKRGRKPKAPQIAFPQDREFTAPELVSQLGVKTHLVSNEINKALREGRITLVGAQQSSKGRGRNCKVFKVI